MNQYQQTVPLTPVVKKLVIANVFVWVVGVLILGHFYGRENIFDVFGLVPGRVFAGFWAWQMLTYMFVHSSGYFHVLFNMLSLWWFGAELEQRWGPRFFLSYYLVCGVGAGLIYLAGALIYYLSTGQMGPMAAPLVGASGAVYGLLLAYGLLFGERIIVFMMLFPMKAKFFVMIIGAVELVTLLDTGFGSDVSNLAHLGGILVGFLYLSFVARWRTRRSAAGGAAKRGRNLKLVVNNSPNPRPSEPKYWN